jgi:carboxyl-terminal processing protease
MRRPFVLGVLAVALTVPLIAGFELARGQRTTNQAAMPLLIDQVRAALADGYYKSLSQSVLGLHSVGEMITALRDPYTAYLGASQYKLLEHETSSSYSGIGVGLLPAAKGLAVASLHSGGPASDAGIRVGDTIVAVDGQRVAHLGIAQVIARFTGPVGSRVRIDLIRGSANMELLVTRAVVQAPTVVARLVSFGGSRWGVVHLSTFNFGATPVLAHEVKRLQAAEARGLVLDLRGNPGGLFTQAVSVSSLFLGHGIIVSMIGAHQPLRVLRARPGVITKLPLVVLVDRYTASSAEIVAAALSENHRATLVGQRTFGKALIQALDPLANGDALELTVAHYYTPLGEDISSRGVVPQIHAVDDPRTSGDEALAVALRALSRPTG